MQNTQNNSEEKQNRMGMIDESELQEWELIPIELGPPLVITDSDTVERIRHNLDLLRNKHIQCGIPCDSKPEQ